LILPPFLFFLRAISASMDFASRFLFGDITAYLFMFLFSKGISFVWFFLSTFPAGR